MSKETWLAQCYPRPAEDVPKEEALAHSLQKWRGLRKAALAEHELTAPPIRVGGETCALCVNHSKPVHCSTCPLALSRDGTACDELDPLRDVERSPWTYWVQFRDPEPMITALEGAQE